MAVCRLRSPSLQLIRRLQSLPDYTEKPEYPPILDLSRMARTIRQEELWAKAIQNLETVEEKLMKVNMPRYYGWSCMSLEEGNIPYNSLDFVQYITRTCINEQQDLPDYYQKTGITDSAASLLGKVKDAVKEAIALEYSVQRIPKTGNGSTTKHVDGIEEYITKQINRVIINCLSSDFPHLQSCQVDLDPRLESFWIVGGIDASTQHKKFREMIKAYDMGCPVNKNFQYIGHPIVHLRHEHPLLPIAEESVAQNVVNTVPVFQYDPRVIGIQRNHRHVTNIPGFWPGDAAEFPLMSIHSSKCLGRRPESYDDSADAPYVQAVLASFAWLQSIACYQGFSTYHDVTYPLVTQTVLTDGQHWSFYVYQMNTMLLHRQHARENKLCNLCWGTKKLKLYEKIEDGNVVGLNEEVLKTLLCFYLNAPQTREGVELKPYLGTNVKYIADIVEDERRAWLEKHFKHMYNNLPRHILPYEMYNWEKIYKVDHKTRPMDARRRPFELGEKPFKKSYYDHTPTYVPKEKRKLLARSYKKYKWEDTYYP